MKKAIIIIIVVLGAVHFMNMSGWFRNLNDLLTKLISGEPDYSCQVDSDCKMSAIHCGPCSCAKAVNKDWNIYCPFEKQGYYEEIYCDPCWAQSPQELKCIDNKCTIK